MELIWTNNLSVQNRAIDNAHKELIGMINRIAQLIESGDIATLPEAFKLLEESLCAYFSIEKNIAQTLDVGFIKHELAHQRMLNKFRRIKDELTTKNGKWSNLEEIYYVDLLEYYLIRHIRQESEPLKAVLAQISIASKPPAWICDFAQKTVCASNQF